MNYQNLVIMQFNQLKSNPIRYNNILERNHLRWIETDLYEQNSRTPMPCFGKEDASTERTTYSDDPAIMGIPISTKYLLFPTHFFVGPV